MKLNEVFKPILEDNVRPSYINRNDINDFPNFSKEIRDYFEKGRFLYRGMKRTDDFILGDSTHMKRLSSSGNNYANLVIDELSPEWRKFPKRCSSFICTTEAAYAVEFGSVYFVIPLGHPTFAVSPIHDFWLAFDIGDVGELQSALNYVFHILSPIEIKKTPTKQEFLSYLELIDDADTLNSSKGGTDRRWIFDEIKKSGKSALNFLIDELSPDRFELSKEIPDAYSAEVWFTGKALFIDRDYAITQRWVK